MPDFLKLLRATCAALAPCLAMLAAPAALAKPVPVGVNPDGTPPGYNASCNCYRNVPYGTVEWVEPTTGKLARQVMDIWMPDAARSAGPHPVVYFGHANGADHVITYSKAADSMWTRFVKPLTEAGYIVVSYEFRHPVTNYVTGKRPPAYDIRKAVNYFANVYARVLNADPANSFITGSSRGGGMGLYTALNHHFIGGTVIRAVRVFQAQTTFDCREAADTFVIAAERDAFVAGCHQVPDAGSSLQSAHAAAPAVYLAYDQTFSRRLVRAVEADLHHPDQGLAYCKRHVAAGAATTCQAADKVPGTDAWMGTVELFAAHRVAH